MDTAKSYWNALHSHYEREQIQCDDWLDQFMGSIDKCESPIIDLGCGCGNNTKYLAERGKQVIACDYAPNAIANIRKNFPEVVDAKCIDMTEGLPFPDGCTELVIADLSLHYFTEAVTRFVLEEIQRILKPEGMLLVRVNSVNDVNHGAGQGIEEELHFYRTPDGRTKRFFDESDLLRIFGGWDISYCKESELHRYALPKQLWTMLLQKQTTPL